MNLTTHVPTSQSQTCLALLQMVVNEVLGDQSLPNVILFGLFENKEILCALVALKRAFDNKDGGAMISARLTLWTLLGTAR